MNGGIRNLIKASLRRPVTILMLFSTTILIGMIAKLNLPLNLLPSGFVNSSVSITIPVPNANPQEVEEQVTRPTEEVLRQISGKDRITSVSSKNRSRISIGFSKSKNPDEAFAEVRDLMELAKVAWPEDVQDYRTYRFNMDSDLPILSFGILLPEWESDTPFLIEEKVKKEIESIDGVARVQIWGIVEEAVRIFVDRDHAHAAGVSLYDVATTLSLDNRDVVGGRIEDAGQHFYLRSLGRFRTLDELRDFPIRSNLRLRDVAVVTTAKGFRDWMFRLNNKRSVWCMVNKEANANTVEVCRNVNRQLDEKITRDPRLTEKGWGWFRPELRDMGFVVTSALDNLVESALWGALLALIPLLFFLRRIRLTLIITLAIPSSLLITIGCIYFTGGSLNILSMLGITVAVGMLVDNSIVVVENIYRHREEGLPAREAAIQGTSEVALAITVATLTTVAAFLPLIYMTEDANITLMTKGIGLPVCWAVLASLLVAIVFIPLATIVLYRDKNPDRNAGLLSRLGSLIRHGSLRLIFLPVVLPLKMADRGIEWLMHAYALLLSGGLQRRWLTFVLVFGITIPAFQGSLDSVKKSATVNDFGGHVSINVEFGSNFSMEDAFGVMQKLYTDLNSGNESEIDYIFYWFNRRGGQVNISLFDKDSASTKTFVTHLSDSLPQYPGVRLQTRIERQSEGQSDLTINVYGQEADILAGIGEDIATRIEPLDDVLAVRSSLETATEELLVIPDRERMQMLGVDPRMLMGTVQYGLRGQRLPDYQADEQSVPMYIEFSDAETTTLRRLTDMGVWSRSGNFQPLSNVADIIVTRGLGSITKVDGQSSLELTVDTTSDDNAAVVRSIRSRLEGYTLPDGYSWTESSTEEFDEALAEIMRTLSLSCILVAILMGILFEAVLLPMAVLISIWFAGCGAIWGLWLTDTPLDQVGMIGFVVLVGIVVNNGIVLLDCAHGMIRRGSSRRDALLEAGRLRLRPILMTTATTVVGLLPMSLIEASGSFISYKALARGIMGGLIVSTIFSLVMVPLCYSVLTDMSAMLRRTLGLLAGRRREAAAPRHS